MLEPARKLKSKEISEKRATPKKRANELDGKKWIQNSISVWSDLSKDGEEKKLGHPAMFPWRLAERLIETFTNGNQNVILDPFVGAGSTLIACHMLGKSGVGIDISKEYLNLAKKRLSETPLILSKKKTPEQQLIHGSAEAVAEYLKPNSVDMVITSPPYWNILTQKRSADMKEVRDYAKPTGNLGHIESYEEYIHSLQDIFAEVRTVLKTGAYCVVNVMDLRKKSQFFPLHMDLTRAMEQIGFELDDIIIWDRKRDYNNLRPLGYPCVFRVNKVHEFLLIFKKTADGENNR